MNGHFGIDAAGYAHQGLLERAVSTFGPVAFWGRYLPDYAILPEEIGYLHAHGVAILPLWNGETATSVGYGADYGRERGADACRAWRALGLPDGCAVYCDIEQQWAPSGEFVKGFLEGCREQNMIGGVYINPRYGNGHAAAYRWARANGAAPGVVYSSQNEVFADTAIREFLIGYPHAEPVPGYEAECVVYQTWEQSLGGAVDLDCANDRGMGLMWGAAPPPPPAYHIATPCSLKQQPNHTSNPAIDPRGARVYLEAGADVAPTGNTATTGGEAWVGVRLTRGEAVVHGWVLKSALAEGP